MTDIQAFIEAEGRAEQVAEVQKRIEAEGIQYLSNGVVEGVSLAHAHGGPESVISFGRVESNTENSHPRVAEYLSVNKSTIFSTPPQWWGHSMDTRPSALEKPDTYTEYLHI